MADGSKSNGLAQRVAALKAEPLRHAGVIAERDALVAELGTKNAVLTERIMELERHIGLNGTNSGKPPLSDSLSKPKTEASGVR